MARLSSEQPPFKLLVAAVLDSTALQGEVHEQQEGLA